MADELVSNKNRKNVNIELVAENALLLSWQATISLTQHHEIISLQALITEQLDGLVVESLVSYHCLMLYFRPQLITNTEIIAKINHLIKYSENSLNAKVNEADCIKIPVYYDTEQQWDLADVAKRCNLSIEQIIKQHSANIYHGFALGFTPGFCYLASLPKSLHLPRKSSPRTKIPKGAVAIAEQQSAIYPIESPGGWHIIGQTPLHMYESSHGQFNATIKVGQNVQFYAISKAEFFTLQQGLQK